MNVLVTGERGFIGRHVVCELQRQGHKPVHEQVNAKIDACIHLAWRGRPAPADVDGNLYSLQTSFELIRTLLRVKCRRLITVGSYYEIHGGGDELYRRSKTMLARIAELTPISHAHAILGNIYGPGDRPAALVPSVIHALADGDVVTLRSNGLQVRDYLHARDAARGLVTILESDTTGDIQVGTGIGVTVREVATTIAEQMRCPDALAFGPSLPTNERPWMITYPSKLHALGWMPTVPLSLGLQETIAAYDRSRTELPA